MHRIVFILMTIVLSACDPVIDVSEIIMYPITTKMLSVPHAQVVRNCSCKLDQV